MHGPPLISVPLHEGSWRPLGGRWAHVVLAFNHRLLVIGGVSHPTIYRDVWSTADGQAWSLVTNDAVLPSHGLRATLGIVAYRAVGAMTTAVAPAILIFGPPKVSLCVVGLALQSSPRKSNFCALLLSFCNFQFC